MPVASPYSIMPTHSAYVQQMSATRFLSSKSPAVCILSSEFRKQQRSIKTGGRCLIEKCEYRKTGCCKTKNMQKAMKMRNKFCQSCDSAKENRYAKLTISLSDVVFNIDSSFRLAPYAMPLGFLELRKIPVKDWHHDIVL